MDLDTGLSESAAESVCGQSTGLTPRRETLALEASPSAERRVFSSLHGRVGIPTPAPEWQEGSTLPAGLCASCPLVTGDGAWALHTSPELTGALGSKCLTCPQRVTLPMTLALIPTPQEDFGIKWRTTLSAMPDESTGEDCRARTVREVGSPGNQGASRSSAPQSAGSSESCDRVVLRKNLFHDRPLWQESST